VLERGSCFSILEKRTISDKQRSRHKNTTKNVTEAAKTERGRIVLRYTLPHVVMFPYRSSIRTEKGHRTKDNPRIELEVYARRTPNTERVFRIAANPRANGRSRFYY
jgi:hypothetical protein